MILRSETGDILVFYFRWGDYSADVTILAGAPALSHAPDDSAAASLLPAFVVRYDGEKFLIEDEDEFARVIDVEEESNGAQSDDAAAFPFLAAYSIVNEVYSVITERVQEQHSSEAFVAIDASVFECNQITPSGEESFELHDQELMTSLLVDSFNGLVRSLDLPHPLCVRVLILHPNRLTDTMDEAVRHYYDTRLAVSLLEAQTEEIKALMPALEEPASKALGERLSSVDAVREVLSREVEPLRISQEQTLTAITSIARYLERDSLQMLFLLSILAENLPRQRRSKAQRLLESRIKQWRDLPKEARDGLTSAQFLSLETALNSSETTPLILTSIGAAAEITGRTISSVGFGAGLDTIIARITRATASGSRFERLSTMLDELKGLRDAAVHSLRDVTRADVARAWELALGDGTQLGAFDLLVQFSAASARGEG